ncbi:MAG: hypothetical protein E7581_02305 [Ruminococcaceae bacterium]|nr:hypothetical protein [Oscillospiraceae bacterium]
MKSFAKLAAALLLICALLCSCTAPQPGPEQGTTLGTEQTIQTPTTEAPVTDAPTQTPTEGTTQAPTEAPTEAPTTEEESTEPPVDPNVDPYENMSADEFYSNYEPADDYWDSYWRTQHGFMSGSIEPQDQKPTIADYQPMEDGKYVRNTYAYFSDDGNTYYIVDGYGEVVNQVFKGGAYVSLEEVAAYVFAFGDIPVNYSSSKRTDPDESIWGEYLRVNHTKFSGSTSKYPYEPELPDISGCGGSLTYYEIDIGTTGTDCDPSYRPAIYNNGSNITRGAARIVYARFDANGDKIIDINERYLFYTYNHYNDFQEYLNYQGGWGEMFGNVTGGGTISSKTDYNPTPYVPVVRRDFVNASTLQAPAQIVVVYYAPKFAFDGAVA